MVDSRALLAAVSLVLFLVAPLAADEIHLKTGGKIVGTILSQDEKEVTVRLASGGVVTVERERIERIEEKEDPKQAYAERAAALPAEDSDGRLALARYCLENDLRDEAVAELRRALASRPGFEAALALVREILEPEAKRAMERASAVVRKGATAAAFDLYREILDRYPETSAATDAELAIARLLLSMGEAAQARERLEPVLARIPGHLGAIESLGRAALALGDYAAALDASLRLSDGRTRSIRRLVELAGLPTDPGPTGTTRAFEEIDLLAALESPAGVRRVAARLLDADRSGSVSLEGADRARAHSAVVESEAALGRNREAREACRAAALSEIPADRKDEFARLARRFDVALRYGKAADGVDPDRVSDLEAEVDAYLSSADEARRREALGRIREWTQGNLALLAAVLESGRSYPTDSPRGTSTDKVRLASGEEAEYARFVPSGYDPERAAPLVLSLHGQGGNGGWAVDLLDEEAERRGYLVAGPSADPSKGLGFSSYGVELVIAVLADMKAKYHVDPDRVYLDGVSMGGHATFALAGLCADRFAAMVSRCGAATTFFGLGYSAESQLHVPAYLLAGEKDGMVPPEHVTRSARELEDHGVPVILRVIPNKGHVDFPEENGAVFDWLADKARPRDPERVAKVMPEERYGRAYWLRVDSIFTRGQSLRVPLKNMKGEVIEEFTIQRSPAKVEARVAPGNRIEIRADRVASLTVFLSDRMLDLDSAIEIVANGKPRFKGKKERSVEYLLEHCRKTGERDRTYWNEVRIDLK
ncbi:MAG: dienelactone hydrolase family protein [Planctomycetes bacterium]|nr:dienelactone hydrolase family protein [Planctomycetota bacterium]